MNNILTFEDYKKMNIRQVESLIYRQFIDEDIKEENGVNEGFIRKAINKSVSKLIQTALADEIEKGKELEKSIKEALDGLNVGIDDIKNKINNKQNKNNSKLDAIEKIKDAIKAVQSQAFDTLTMIGSEGEIDFAGFIGSASVVGIANFGILFDPIRTIFITRKAYKYFLGIIKQTIRRNLLIIQLNFDQFENLILQKSFENEDIEANAKQEAIHDVISKINFHLCDPNSKLGVIKGNSNIKKIKTYLETLKKYQDVNKNMSSPFSSLWQDQHNNTYTRTLEQIKQYINDDSQKELDSLKNSITKMAGNDVDLTAYGELMIAAAEEYAIKTNHGINNNFIKMSSVFNLENQKKLIELIVETEKEQTAKINKLKEEQKNKDLEDQTKKNIEKGKEIYEKDLKDSTEDFTIDSFEKKFGDDIKCLRAFFTLDDDGKKIYEDLIDKKPLYKYFIEEFKDLNEFLEALNELEIVEVENVKSLSDQVVHEDQALYYMMAERSIKDAIKPVTSKKYFGFEEIDGKDTDEIEKSINTILKDNIFPTYKKTAKSNKKIYFLKTSDNGEGLFNILHKDFKTKLFNEDKTYIDNISIENKLNISDLIFKNLKIGNNIRKRFAQYLVRLEAHMLLTKKDPYFVIENNEELKDCFDPDTEEIQNKNAFVEISSNDYEDIKKFLSTFRQLYNNEFNQESNEKD